MRMKKCKFWLTLLSLALVVSCGDEKKVEKHSKPEDVVLAAYNNLIKGEYEKYVMNVQSCDSITEKYRKSLIIAAKQFMAKEKEENGGIISVNVVDAKTNKIETYSLVMLILNYGDSTSEEVAVPVVKVGESWRLR